MLTTIHHGNMGAASDKEPDAVDWANISGAETASNANQTLQNFDSPITLRLDYTESGTPAAVFAYSLNGGGFTTIVDGGTLSVSDGDTLRWQVTAFGAAGTVSGIATIVNESDSDTTLDTFTYSVSTSGI